MNRVFENTEGTAYLDKGVFTNDDKLLENCISDVEPLLIERPEFILFEFFNLAWSALSSFVLLLLSHSGGSNGLESFIDPKLKRFEGIITAVEFKIAEQNPNRR
eukprot:gene31806-41278_t